MATIWGGDTNLNWPLIWDVIQKTWQPANELTANCWATSQLNCCFTAALVMTTHVIQNHLFTHAEQSFNCLPFVPEKPKFVNCKTKDGVYLGDGRFSLAGPAHGYAVPEGGDRSPERSKWRFTSSSHSRWTLPISPAAPQRCEVKWKLRQHHVIWQLLKKCHDEKTDRRQERKERQD